MDLIQDFTRDQKSASPAKGCEQMTKLMQVQNVPRQAIGNINRWYKRDQNHTWICQCPINTIQSKVCSRKIFTSICSNLNGIDRGNGIDLNSFKSGTTLFVFDLTADGTDSSYWDGSREGTIRLDA